MYHFKEAQSLANRISTLILVLFLGTVLLFDCTGMPTKSLCIKFDTKKKKKVPRLSVHKFNKKNTYTSAKQLFQLIWQR